MVDGANRRQVVTEVQIIHLGSVILISVVLRCNYNQHLIRHTSHYTRSHSVTTNSLPGPVLPHNSRLSLADLK